MGMALYKLYLKPTYKTTHDVVYVHAASETHIKRMSTINAFVFSNIKDKRGNRKQLPVSSVPREAIISIVELS